MVEDPWLGPFHFPDTGDEVYVAWIDLMGVGDAMSRSYKGAATNIGKLYAAISNHDLIEDMKVYPMADGLYILSENKDGLRNLLMDIFYQFGLLTFRRQTDPDDGFGPWIGILIRGGIAQGTVYHGSDFDEDGKSDLADVDWMENVPFGKPIANAHHVERTSAPYSITVHESATDDPGPWKWWKDCDEDIRPHIVMYLDDHLSWALKKIDNLLYEDSNLYVHAEKAEEFFELPDGYFDLD